MQQPQMVIQLIVDPINSGWILGKIARKIAEGFEAKGYSVQILGQPIGNSDVVFWMYYGDLGILDSNLSNYKTKIESALVTHVDDANKLRQVKKIADANIDLIFMSKEHANSISTLLEFRERPFNILAGSDLVDQRRKMRVGLFTKTFPDSRKNEEWLILLAKEVDIQSCELVIVGTGWNKIYSRLRELGINVEVYDGIELDYPKYSDFTAIYNTLDLYVYLGFDEGSMGALDAFLLKCEMLISRQGFHLEFNLSEDSYFSDYNEFRNKFLIRMEQYRIQEDEFSKWSWARTIESLEDHWILHLENPNLLEAKKLCELNFPEKIWNFYKRRREYKKLLKQSLIRFFKLRLKNWVIRQIQKKQP
jgi:hypothetical protein